MPDLLKSMGLGRASFYNAFGSKREIFLKSLNLYFATVDAHLTQAMAQDATREKSVTHLIDAILAVTQHESVWRGCLIGNTALEMGSKDTEISLQLGRGVRMLRKKFAEALKKPSADKSFNDVNVEALALHLVAGIQGLLVLAKAGLPRADIARARNLLISTLN